ncbi:class I SAM-dependent methyltransferase [Streptomyces sp. NPDC050388]|uniref:class I SAM-dependent methyltransferase n=1 Tax=Streptomyces sp. NPDC050388 TaxID=3155781 RepID=UPI0034260FBA
MGNDITLCQTCRDVPVTKFLSLGAQPACNFPENYEETETERTWPLDLGFCSRCSLVQLMKPVSERILFSGDYHHLAGLTKGFREHLRELADELAAQQDPDPRRRRVIEIGSNDGSLLDALAERGFDVLGVDPCGSVSPNGSAVVTEYFGSKVAKQLMSSSRSANIVVATNTFAHVTDLHDFLDGLCTILKADGMFVSESHYLPELLRSLQYDFVYHEHSRYYSLTALQHVFGLHGLEVFHIERIDTHGGSIRVYAGFQGAHEVHESVAELRREEDAQKLTDEATYQEFAARVEDHRDRFRHLVKELSSDGSRIAGSSCPARAVTLLNYCSLGPADIEFVSEISPLKIGRLFPGVHIPVVSQEELCGPEQPDYAVLFSWHILDELSSRLREEGFRGKFIVPLPEPHVLSEP